MFYNKPRDREFCKFNDASLKTSYNYKVYVGIKITLLQVK